MKLSLLVLVACSTIACAKVSIVDDDNDGGGSSSSNGGHVAGVGGGGGAGGGPSATCEPGELRRVGSLVDVPLGDAVEHLFPRLLQRSSGEVMLAVSARPVDGSYAHSPAVSMIDPWTAWPPAIEPPTILPYGCKGWTEVGALGEDAYLLTSTLDGTFLLPNVLSDPSDAVLMTTEPVKFIHFGLDSGESILLRTDGSNGTVVTTAWPSGASEVLSASCAELDLADAVPVPGGFLVAERFATLEGAQCPSSTVDLLVSRYSVSESGELLREVVETIPVGQFGYGRLVERSDGAWLLIQSEVPGDLPFSARRLDTDGLTISEPVELSQTGGFSSASRVGDGFMIGRFIYEFGAFRVELFGDDGTLRKSAEFTDASVSVGGAAQFLPSPDGSSLLVAFFGTDGDGDYRTVLARFECLDS